MFQPSKRGKGALPLVWLGVTLALGLAICFRCG